MKYIYSTILLIITVIVFTDNNCAQQLPLYSQYYFNDYAVNPAIGGTKSYIDARSNHRYQWQGIADAPRTYTLSIHGPLKNNYAGIGAFLYTDHVGPTRRTGAQLSYTYKLKLTSRIKLGLALSGGILEWKLDAHKIDLYDPNDQVIVNGVMRSLVPDAKFGAHLYHPKWFVGFTMPNLLQSKLKFNEALYTGLSRLENHFIVNGGYKFRVAKDFKVEPSAIIKYISPAPVQADIMARVIWKDKLWLGGVYRTMDAASVLLGVTYKQNLSFGYAYDFTTTNLRNYSTGTHELFIGIRFSNTKANEENDISSEFLKDKKSTTKTNLKHLD
ncbi:MAG: type IX secretion system membrane protein PorP/SprF [Flavobacteriales bacterium]|jgi:type IX secretion system PorP/SprF family membrane protein|nr:type IX secretion system membrane protein PorP/SprF [Flavobacteriales bacterium]